MFKQVQLYSWSKFWNSNEFVQTTSHFAVHVIKWSKETWNEHWDRSSSGWISLWKPKLEIPPLHSAITENNSQEGWERAQEEILKSWSLNRSESK